MPITMGMLLAGTPAKNLTYIAKSSGLNLGAAITLPAGLQKGDLCIIDNWGDAGTSYVTPSGFTTLAQFGIGSTGNNIHTLSYKILDGSETSVSGYNISMESYLCFLFRPDGDLALNTITFTLTGSEATAYTPAGQSISMAGQSPCVLGLGFMGANNGSGGYRSVSPRYTYPAMNEEVGAAGNGHWGHYMIYNQGSSPVTHTYAMEDEGRNHLVSGYFVIS